MIRVGFVFSVVPLSVPQLVEHAKPAEQKVSTLSGRLLPKIIARLIAKDSCMRVKDSDWTKYENAFIKHTVPDLTWPRRQTGRNKL